MSALGRRNCGHCSKCTAGMPNECYFPAFDFGSKSLSGVSASALSHDYFTNPKALKLSKSPKGYSKKSFESCYKSHPPFKINEQITVYGGAASYPVQKDCDIYVSLDRYGRPDDLIKYPWEEGPHPLIVNFPVPDMSIPGDPEKFKKLVDWLKKQAQAGKKIHIGCIGGHGRTGTLLAALTKEITGNEDAITFVREHYCHRAVESSKQVDFLHKTFGIKKVKGYKSFDSSLPYAVKEVTSDNYNTWDTADMDTRVANAPLLSETRAQRHNRKFSHTSDDVAYPVKALTSSKGNIWGV